MHFRKLIKVLAFALILTTASAGVPAYAAQAGADIFTYSDTTAAQEDASGGEASENGTGSTDDASGTSGSTSDGSSDTGSASGSTSGTASDGTSDAGGTSGSTSDTDTASGDGTEDTSESSAETESGTQSDASGSSSESSSSQQSSKKNTKKNKNKKNKNKKNKKKTQEEKDAEKAEKKKQRLNAKWRASVKPYTVSTTTTVNSPYDTYHLIGDSSVASFTFWWNGYNAITSHYTYTKTKNMTETTDTADIIAAASDPLVSSLVSGTSDARSGLFEVLYKFDYANKTAETVDFTAQSTTASALTDLTQSDTTQTDLTQTGTALTGLIPAESVDTLLVEAYAQQFTAACAEETEDNTGTTSAVVFSYGQSDAEAGNYKAALEYVQEVEEAAAADDSNAYFVVSLLPTGDKQTDKKIRRYNRVLRTAASQNAHVHYIDVYEYAKKQKIYADGDLTEKESKKLYQRIRKMTARFNTEQAREETTYATQWDIPSGLGRAYTYMGWSKITCRSSSQYRLRSTYGEEYDADGFAKIQADTDRYVIACTTYFGRVGDLIDFTLSNGEVIHTIVGDIKNQKDEGCTILGHQYGQSIVEFVVNTSLWYGTSKTVAGFHPEWAGCSVSKVTNYGNISEQ